MTPDPPSAARGWYEDPEDSSRERFWGGSEWAHLYRPRSSPSHRHPSKMSYVRRTQNGFKAVAKARREGKLAASPEPAADAAPASRDNRAVWLPAGGVIVGSLLPWAGAGIFTVAGTSGDGIFTLVLGGLMAFSASAASGRVAGLAVTVFSALALRISWGVFDRLDQAVVGGGLLLVVVSSAVGVLLGLSLALRRQPTQR